MSAQTSMLHIRVDDDTKITPSITALTMVPCSLAKKPVCRCWLPKTR